jgi:hypothetical protein
MAPLAGLPDCARRLAMRLMLIATIGVPLAGCWPARLTERPKVVGAVISGTDGTPITGASVTLVPSVESAFKVVTDGRGVFQIKSLHSWALLTILGENFPGHGTVVVDAAGFVPELKEISWPLTGARPLIVGVIELRESPP